MKLFSTLIALCLVATMAAAASNEKEAAASTPAASVSFERAVQGTIAGNVAHRHLQGAAADFDFGMGDLDDCGIGGLMECFMDKCNTCEDAMTGDDMGGDDANLDVSDCGALGDQFCPAFVQSANAIANCCPQCSTQAIDYLECSYKQTLAMFCPDEEAECDISVSAAGSLGGGGMVVAAIGAIVSVGMLF